MQSGENHVHDPKNFGFTKQSTVMKDVHNGAYFYNQPGNLK